MKDMRRQFLKGNLALGLASALGCVKPAISGYLSEEQLDARKSAEYVMVFASSYDSDNWQLIPHMHQQIKLNIEELSEGRIYVDIYDKGQLGVGTELMAQVSRGHISSALVSASNLSPVAPQLDVLNIPFWAAENQHYLNLVTSPAWRDLVLNPIGKQGRIDVLFPYIVGARTAASTKTYNHRFAIPSDITDVTFRIPSSQVLRQFYQLLGTKPVSVNWKEVAGFSRKNLIQGLDPSIVGLLNGPDNLKAQIGVISEIDSVHDGWMAVVSQKWRNSLPNDLQEVLIVASEKTFRQQLEWAQPCTENCRVEFSKLGVETYTPTLEEKAKWRDIAGFQRAEWSAMKQQILGKADIFNELLEASQINNGYSLLQNIS